MWLEEEKDVIKDQCEWTNNVNGLSVMDALIELDRISKKQRRDSILAATLLFCYIILVNLAKYEFRFLIFFLGIPIIAIIVIVFINLKELSFKTGYLCNYTSINH